MFGDKNPNKEILIKNYELNDNGISYINFNNENRIIKYSFADKSLSKDEIERKYISQRKFIFGTDSFGRDVFGRIMLGTRVSLSIGFIAVLISLIIGLSIGMIGGYYGGIVDKVVVSIINIFWSIPTLLLVIAISIALGKGFWQVYVAVGLTMWVEVARVVRGQVISEKNKDYIVATKVLGFSDLRIFIKHIIPNIIGPILIIFLGSYLLKRSLKETRHENEEECNDPMHFHFNDTKYASPFITGLVAGSIPCPSAIAVLLIASNKFQEDIITLYSSIFIYVLGIALTLISIMTLFLLFKDRFVNQLNAINKTFNTNVIAAILIIMVGVLYFLLSFFGIQHQH